MPDHLETGLSGPDKLQASSRLFPKLNDKRRRLVIAVLKNPEATDEDLKNAAGFSSIGRMRTNLKHPQVSEILHTCLDEHGAKLLDSARVVGEAHNAMQTKVFQHKGEIVKSEPMVDHAVRLQAAEINLKVRGKLKDQGMTVNVFDGMKDDEIAAIAAGQKTMNDFVDVTPGGAS